MKKRKPIALCGLMGAGKTTLGRALAQERGMRFIDADAVIEERVGASIAEIFRKQGETLFRQHEERIGIQLSAESNCIVALGGGAMSNPAIREAWLRRGITIYVEASIDTCLERTRQSSNRPLLTRDAEGVLKRHLRDREHAYSMATLKVQNDASPTEALDALRDPLDAAIGLNQEFLRDVVVSQREQVPLYLGDGVFDALPKVLKAHNLNAHKLFVLHPPPLRAHARGFAASRAGVHTFEVPAGEAAKTWAVAEAVLHACSESGLDRSSTFLALGGGTVTDLGAFVASSYMRGIDFVSIPTTLLAMVDASVGGKCGVNLGQAKNRVGAFYNAKAVLVDPVFLTTLPQEELRAGLGEMVKHALLGPPELLQNIEKSAASFVPTAQTILESIAVKRNLVEQDPKEHGIRAHLNLGHTFAHAIESESGFTLAHGLCVAIGLSAATKLSAELGMLDDDDVTRVDSLLSALKLPRRIRGTTAAALLHHMKSDKKHQGAKQRFIALQSLGQAKVVVDPSVNALDAALAHILTRAEDDPHALWISK